MCVHSCMSVYTSEGDLYDEKHKNSWTKLEKRECFDIQIMHS